jgi:hypothetical protein
MTDYYKTTLEVLAKILQEENYDHWARWMQKDIKLWGTKKSVEHHLQAYGGMGSFNDVIVGSNDNIGIWKSQVFGHLQTLAYCLAKGNSIESILEIISKQPRSEEISGWRCRNCNDSRISERDINLFISRYFIPTYFIKYVQENRLEEVVSIPQLIELEEVINKKSKLKSLIQQENILLNLDNNWL